MEMRIFMKFSGDSVICCGFEWMKKVVYFGDFLLLVEPRGKLS
jgi:hypothetical protein